MDLPQIWARLRPETRQWLSDHNGEPLPDVVVTELLSVTQGERDASWWAGESRDGETQLTDAAVDWIEETANQEGPGGEGM